MVFHDVAVVWSSTTSPRCGVVFQDVADSYRCVVREVLLAAVDRTLTSSYCALNDPFRRHSK
jgi:hypothetical protein